MTHTSKHERFPTVERVTTWTPMREVYDNAEQAVVATKPSGEGWMLQSSEHLPAPDELRLVWVREIVARPRTRLNARASRGKQRHREPAYRVPLRRAAIERGVF